MGEPFFAGGDKLADVRVENIMHAPADAVRPERDEPSETELSENDA
jgi:hypothetical protein